MHDQPTGQPGTAPTTRPVTRQGQKAERRERLLDTAKSLFAHQGFHAVSLADLGAGADISAPAVYRHFASKEAVLAELLVGISERLSEGGESVAASSDADVLERLVDFHVDFAMSEPELIRIQDRDFPALPDDARATVRRLQRRYINVWCGALRTTRNLAADEAEVRVRAVFGLINSTPHLGSRLPTSTTRRELTLAARRALGTSSGRRKEGTAS